MKNVFILTFALMAFNANAFINNQGFSTGLDYAGSVVAETVEKNFIFCKANGAISAGMSVALDLAADDGATCVKGTTTGLAPIGLAVSDIADGKLGKVQTYGLFESALFDSTNSASVAGKRAWMSTNNAGYISARGTEVATEIAIGYFYDVASASGSSQVFIKL